MEYMTCNTCKRVVNTNRIGICLNCQKGFDRNYSEDAYSKEGDRRRLEVREKELVAEIENLKKLENQNDN